MSCAGKCPKCDAPFAPGEIKCGCGHVLERGIDGPPREVVIIGAEPSPAEKAARAAALALALSDARAAAQKASPTPAPGDGDSKS